MATGQTHSVLTLFNDPLLSDVKIKQIHDGKTREYFAHKAILSAQAPYFLKAFTGEFKEANEPTMELLGDDFDHFEVALKFIYTLVYDAQEIKTRANKHDKLGEAIFIMGIYKVAEKYDIKRLLHPTADHLQKVIEATTGSVIVDSVVRKHYSTCSYPGSIMGAAIASTTTSSRKKLSSTKFVVLIHTFPVFGADIALHHYALRDF